MKRRLQKLACAMLLLAILLSSIPMANAMYTQDFVNSETYLRTSYSEDNYIELSISGNTLTVNGKLQLDGLTGLLVQCGDQSAESTLNVTSGQEFTVRIALTHSGVEPISFYSKVAGERSYWSFSLDRIFIEKAADGYRIVSASVLEQNLALMNAYVNPDRFCDSSGVPESVRNLSNEIVGDEQDAYTKLFLLHKWVAENIYYDYDAYYTGSYRYGSSDSENVLESRRSVCEGYSNLLRDLILAQGIPCMKVTTYALGVSSYYDSFAISGSEADTNDSNHAHVEAWVDDRWVIMDATWDSNNKYQYETYNTKAPNGFTYFDITQEAISLDHKYVTRGNGTIYLKNGTVIGADTPVARPKATVQGFSDVVVDDYFANAVRWAVKNKITTGTTATTFSPNSTCTTAQILTFLWRANGAPEPADVRETFSDLQPDDYFYKAALWAKENGLVEGETLNGIEPCTRYATMEYIWKLAGKPKPQGTNPFADVSGQTQPVVWAVEQGITSGTSATTFAPTDTCTRAQIVTFLYRTYAN